MGRKKFMNGGAMRSRSLGNKRVKDGRKVGHDKMTLKKFMFEANWTKEKECEGVVRKGWLGRITSAGQKGLCHKLKNYRVQLLN
ncbi:hypothetical protein GOBAR_DD33969 [Gossypium barbadense]|nr:hypothetical protein GOBAR_DD33969 [Gossypium barbadense]